MSAIVERLRALYATHPVVMDAADELARLRSEAAARADTLELRWQDVERLEAELERLRVENDMLRSLLVEAPTKEERDETLKRRFGDAFAAEDPKP